MSLLNYTTKIPAEQTIGEIQQMLSKYGVSAMMTEYDEGNVSSVSFRLNIDGRTLDFRLPCNWKAVLATFEVKSGKRNIWDEDRKVRIENERKAQAIRTAWRIIHVWVKAQLALVEVNMISVPQIFLPYAVMKDGQTLSEHVISNPKFLLE